LLEREVVGMDLAVDLELAGAPRDQLRVLRSEVEDEDPLTIDGHGSPRLAGALVLGQHLADAIGEQAHQRRQLARRLCALERVAIVLALFGANERANQAALEQPQI